MNLPEFYHHLLASVGDDNEARTASTAVLSTLCSSDPLFYLRQIWTAIMDPSDARLQIASITILFSQLRAVCAFCEPHVITQFWLARFLPDIPVLLAMTSIPEHIKLLVMDIVVAIGFRARTNIALPLLELLSREPTFDLFLVHALCGLIRDSRALGEIPLDAILSVISLPCSFLPRFSLYFATATACPDSPVLLSLFPSILAGVSTFEADAAVRILIDFCENVPLFFADHIDPFVGWICSLIADRSCPARGPATSLLAALSSHAPAICAASAFFFPTVFLCLASAMTEIPADVPLLVDLTSSDIHVLAADALHSVFISLRVGGLPSPALPALESLALSLTDSPSWQQQHALLTMLACLDPCTHTEFFEAPSVHWLASLVLSTALAPSVDARVRAAALHALSAFFANSWPYAQLHFAESLPAIVGLLSVDHADIQLLVLTTLNRFLKYMPLTMLAAAQLEDLLQIYTDTLSSGPPEALGAVLVAGVGWLSRAFAAVGHASACAAVLSGCVSAGTPRAVRVSALKAFCATPPGAEAALFLSAAVELANPAEGHDEALLSALTALLAAAGRAAGPHARAVLPSLFALARAEIAVYAGDPPDPALFMRAASDASRDFVLARDALAVIDALRLIAACVTHAGVTAAVAAAVDAAVERLRAGPPVAEIEVAAWALLAELPGARAAQAALEALLAGLRRPVTSAVAFTAFNAADAALAVVALPGEHVAPLLRVGLAAAGDLLTAVGARVCDEFRFLKTCDEARVRTIVGHLMPFARVVRRLFQQSHGATVAFFIEEIEPRIGAWLEVPGQRFFALWIWGEYFIATGDLGKLLGFYPFIVMILANPEEVDIKDAVFMVLADVFARYELDAEVAGVYFALFMDLENSPVGMGDATDFAWDCAIVALSHLIRRNFALFDGRIAAELWHAAMPFSAQFERAEAPAALLALFLESRNPFILHVLQVTLYRIVTTHMLEFAEVETVERILAALREIAIEAPAHFLGAWTDFTTPQQRAAFAQIVAGTGLELPDVPLRDCDE